MQHFCDSFALVSQICVRREALNLFGLREDELLPDLHITRDGVLRIGLGAQQEHRVNHYAPTLLTHTGHWPQSYSPPDRPRPISMHPGPPLSEPSSSAGAPSSSTPPPRTVHASFEQGPVKGKPSP